MLIPWWQVKFDESAAQAAYGAVKNGKLSMGIITEEFESKVRELLNVRNVVAVSSGSDAILLALLSLDLRPDDEIIIQDRSWIAAAHAVIIIGATPILVDVEKNIPTISISDLKKKITKKTKAVIVVHMNGRHTAMHELVSLTEGHGIQLIEDAAQAIGSKYENQFLGTFGEMGCFSLSVAKLIGSGQGGFIVTDSDSRADVLKRMRTHGLNDTKEARWSICGFNFRFPDPLAAIALSEIGHLSQRLSRQQAVYLKYEKGILDLKRTKLIPSDVKNWEIGPYIEVLVDHREKFVRYMQDLMIETRSFYPSLSAAHYLKTASRCQNAEHFANHGVYLPSGPSITDLEIEFVIDAIKNFEILEL